MEAAVLENFCMDFTLLYCAKLAVKNGAGLKKTALGAAVGACAAVLLPLLPVNGAAAVTIKILSAFIICAAAAKITSFKAYFKYSIAFLAFSALLAGALFGIFYLAGISYQTGNGYIYSSVPVGVPLFGALVLVIAARRLREKFTKGGKKEVLCRIYRGGATAETEGFFDSGNRVYYLGEAVSVVPLYVAQKLVDVPRIKERVKIHTVAGSKTIKVFTAEKLEIFFEKDKKVYKNVRLGVSASNITRAVLHPDILEE